ncbi:hypothetical protein [Thalassovita sp.]|uniref:hypothetical protein n=1 Tax=Thalassovita sp. TaxID=1979401 RepID=UPI0029DE7092|nr:hypothetical protein [Thalassovita sp.]
MTRVIVHAGFHKTGTTSLQALLERNDKRLSPYAAIYLKTALGRARFLGRWYGQRPSLLRLWLFRLGFRTFLRRIPDSPVIVISRESFSGMMLGFRGARIKPPRSYAPMAIPLAQAIIREVRRRFGPDTQIEFLYTTRETEPFLNSAWRHVLRTSRLKQDYTAFRATFSPLPDLQTEADRIAQAIAPVPVHTAALETYADDPLGPGRAILDLLGVPEKTRAKLRPVDHHNPGQSADLSARFLSMNRSKMGRKTLQQEKDRLAMAERPPATRRKGEK